MLCILTEPEELVWGFFSLFFSANSLHLQTNSDHTDFCSCNEFYYFMTHSTFSVVSWVCWDLGFCVVVIVLFHVAEEVIGNPYQMDYAWHKSKSKSKKTDIY